MHQSKYLLRLLNGRWTLLYLNILAPFLFVLFDTQKGTERSLTKMLAETQVVRLRGQKGKRKARDAFVPEQSKGLEPTRLFIYVFIHF